VIWVKIEKKNFRKRKIKEILNTKQEQQDKIFLLTCCLSGNVCGF
jgi:hypothetical protein